MRWVSDDKRLYVVIELASSRVNARHNLLTHVLSLPRQKTERTGEIRHRHPTWFVAVLLTSSVFCVDGALSFAEDFSMDSTIARDIITVVRIGPEPDQQASVLCLCQQHPYRGAGSRAISVSVFILHHDLRLDFDIPFPLETSASVLEKARVFFDSIGSKILRPLFLCVLLSCFVSLVVFSCIFFCVFVFAHLGADGHC